MEEGTGYLMLMVFRIFTYIVFGIFLTTIKFATHNNNIVFLIAMLTVSQVLRIVSQTILEVFL